MIFEGTFVDFKSGVDVVAGFHIHPHGGALFFVLDDRFEIFETKIGRKVEAELGEFHGNFSGEIAFMNTVEHFDVMVGDAAGFVAVGNIFAEMGEDAADVFGQEGLRGGIAASSVSPGMKRETLRRTNGKFTA